MSGQSDAAPRQNGDGTGAGGGPGGLQFAGAAAGPLGPAAARSGGPAGSVRRIRFGNALDSEWAKIRTVRSTYWTLLAVMLVSIGLSALIAAVYAANWNTLSVTQKAQIDISYPLVGVNFGVLVIGVLGVLVVSSEYSSGMMRTSLTALPRRMHLIGAKLLVLGTVCLLAGLVVAFVSYFISEPIYASKGVHLSLSQQQNLRAVLAAAVYLTLVALMGFAFGTLLRHTAGAVTLTLGVMFVLPIITAFLPGTFGKDLNKVMPSNAGGAMMSTVNAATDSSTRLSPLSGFLVLAGTVLVLCVGAFAAFRQRDA